MLPRSPVEWLCIMTIELESTDAGVVIPVQAQPKARRNAVTGEHNGMLKVSVTQAPEKGKANAALELVIATSLGLKKSQVQIVSGQTSSKKKFLISGDSIEVVGDRIKQCLANI
jgi:uncharacterized protein